MGTSIMNNVSLIGNVLLIFIIALLKNHMEKKFANEIIQVKKELKESLGNDEYNKDVAILKTEFAKLQKDVLQLNYSDIISFANQVLPKVTKITKQEIITIIETLIKEKINL